MDKRKNETKQLEILLRNAYEKGYKGATLQELMEDMKKGLQNITHETKKSNI
ncbi:hypothetical protein GMD78_03020 [Ornithinibacillus sp. L9]|uniref:Uncharacterized protein n=1 Tax=Ornithinibacillus caprae TaxID=2678566 RepID=A0A6N8FCI0_9BACI|nr:hypothetical protein [Ornithinibacillus caprae]MUK87372.1 hypothetical protein [Ornithinibacillus caprae]